MMMLNILYIAFIAVARLSQINADGLDEFFTRIGLSNCNLNPASVDTSDTNGACGRGPLSIESYLTQPYHDVCYGLDDCCPNCPCIYNEKFYDDKYVMTDDMSCLKFVCHEGRWHVQEDKKCCCAECTIRNGVHIDSFDNDNSIPGVPFYDFEGVCQYPLTQDDFSTSPTRGVFLTLEECSNQVCLSSLYFIVDDATTIHYNFDIDEKWTVTLNNDPTEYVILITQPVLLNETINVLTWRDGDCIYLHGSEGIMVYLCPDSVTVYAHEDLIGYSGLCGIYNHAVFDDQTGRDGTLHTLNLLPEAAFIQSWATDGDASAICDTTREGLDLPHNHCDDVGNAYLKTIYYNKCVNMFSGDHGDSLTFAGDMAICARDMCANGVENLVTTLDMQKKALLNLSKRIGGFGHSP